MLLQPTFFSLLLSQIVSAAFTQHQHNCWRRDCVVRTDAGTLCFEPQVPQVPQVNYMHSECADIFLSNLLRVHLTSTVGRSIMYYDDEARMLGAATWSVPHDMANSVFVCMTGQLRGVDDATQYRTVCRSTRRDDDMESASAHTRECVSDEKPQHVGDGCFSLISKPAGGDSDGDHKGWYEQPVVAGLFWLLGVLVTLEKICLWTDNAARAIVALLPRLIDVFANVFELVTRRWRRAIVPLPTRWPTPIA